MKHDSEDEDLSMILEDQKPHFIIIPEDNATGSATTATTKALASSLGLSQRRAPPCFLCGSEEARLHYQRQSSTTLIKELGTCFEQFLEFPKDTLQEYMKRCGPLENWIPLCNDCRLLIKEGRELKEQVELLEKRMSDHQQQIVKKVKCSRVNFSGSANEDESLRHLDSMRKYVKAKIYPPDKYKMVAIKTIVKKIVKLQQDRPKPNTTVERKPPTKTYLVSKKVRRKPTPSKTGGTASGGVVTKDLKQNPHPPFDDEVLIDYDDDDGNPTVHTDDLEDDPLAPKKEGETKTFLCGLCIDDDDAVYESEKLLIAHQKKVHGPEKTKTKPKLKKPTAKPEIKAKKIEEVSNPDKKGENASSSTQEDRENSLKRKSPPPSADEDEERPRRKKKKLTSYKSPRSYVKYRYACPNCPKVKGYWLNRYAQHLAIHLRRPYRCSECLEFLPNEEDLQEQHWKDKHEDKEIPSDYEKFVKIKFDPGKIYKCYGCYIGFCSEEERNAHEPKCRKITKSRRTVFKKEEPRTCQTCSKVFRNLNEWRLHRILEHPEVDSLSCFMCDKSFSAKVVGGGDGVVARDDYKFLEHLRTDHPVRERCDTRIYEECEECGVVLNGGEQKPTKKNHILKEHGGILNEKELYPCKYCPMKDFSSAPALRLHVAKDHFLHSFVTTVTAGSVSVTPSLCDNCGKYFKSKWSLYHHNYTQHGVIPEGGQVINCPKEGCQFKSVVRGSVTDHHQRTHVLADTRPYKCKYCPKRYKSTAELKLHHQSHENKETRPFVCEICAASFAVGRILESHRKHVHEKKPYPPSSRKKRAPRRKK